MIPLSASLIVDIAFGYTPLNTSPVWTNVTPYVLSADINRGRNDEFSQYSQGIASITLNNTSRLFDPYFETGAYYGLLRPMTPIRIRLSATVMFAGYVTAWPTKYDISNKYAESNINCVDGTRFLSNSVLDDCPYADIAISEVASKRYFPMQIAEIGKVTSIDGQVLPSTRVARVTASNLPVGQTNTISPTGINPNILFQGPNSPNLRCRRIEFFIDMTNVTTGGGAFFQAFSRRLEVSPGQWRGDYFYASINSSGVLTSIEYQDYDSGQGYVSTTLTIDVKPNIGSNYVVIQAGGGSLAVYVNEVLAHFVATGAYSRNLVLGSELQISSGAGVSHVTFGSVGLADIGARYQAAIGYPNETTSARLSRVLDSVGWPALWRSIETGDQTVGSYRPQGQVASSYLRQIENAEQGTLCVNREGYVRFENRTTVNKIIPVAFFDGRANTTCPYTDIQIDANNIDKIFNIVEAQYEFGRTEQSNGTSITTYGPQAQSIDLSLMSTKTDADTAASVLLNSYKDPRLSIEQLTVNMLSNIAVLELILPSLELGDDVVVIFQPSNTGTVIWRCLKVQGFSHQIRPDEWITNIYLGPSPIQTNGPLLILNNATFGTLTTTNKLA